MGPLEEFERGVGRQIEQAQKDGAFDNLPGKGKPLNLTSNPNTDPAVEAAYRLLKDNDFVLPWMEKGREIDRRLGEARAALARTRDLIARSGPDADWAENEWRRAAADFRERIAAVNRLIRDFNLEIPNVMLERFLVDAEEEIRRAGGPAPTQG